MVPTPGRPAERRRRSLPLVLLGVALFVVGLRPASNPAAEATVSVVVAARPIAAASTISPADLSTITLASSSLDGAWLRSSGAAAGRRALVAIPAGSPLVAGMLGDRASEPDRLVSLEVGAADGSVVTSGDIVDIAAISGDDGSARVVATGRVVAIDASSAGASTRTVIVDCSSPDALAVIAAESPSRALHLLRHQG